MKHIYKCVCALSLLLMAGCALAGEEPKNDPSVLPAGPLARELYSDPAGGFTVLLPPGYKKLSEDETHAIFEGLSEYYGKEVGERARKRPPVWFKGPADSKDPKSTPPTFAVGQSDSNEQIDPAQIPAYKEKMEEESKRQGKKFGEVVLSVVKVDGIESLQVEHDVFSGINNARSRLIRVGVPAKGKWYDLAFTCDTDQVDTAREALKYVLDSFKVAEHPPENMQNTIKWTRVFAYTVGFGLAGVLLSLLMRKFGGGKPA